MAENPLKNIVDLVQAARRFREIAHDPAQRSRREILVPIFTFFTSQLPLVGFVPMHIAVKRLEDRLRSKGLTRQEAVHLKCLRRSIARDADNQSRGAAPRDLIKFKISDPRPWPREIVTGKAAQIAFWQQKYDDMFNAWGSKSEHEDLGLDGITSDFLCHLSKRLSNKQKQQLLQHYRDYQHKLADDLRSAGFDTIWDGVPEFRMEVHSEVNPPLGPVDIERAYQAWAATWKMPKRVTTPLFALAQRLRRPRLDDQFDIERAFVWYGSEYDATLSAQNQAIRLAACVVAAENWQGQYYDLDERMEKRLRAEMRSDKLFLKSIR